MKKLTLAAVALLAIAGLAMAQDTFTITLTGGANNTASISLDSDKYVSNIASSLTLGGNIQNTTENSFIRVNRWVWEGSTLSFDLEIADGYTLTAMTIAGNILGTGTAPGNLAWTVGGKEGDSFALTTSSMPFNTVISNLSNTGNVKISLAGVGTTTVNNADRSANASWAYQGAANIYTTTFTGTVQQSVPEPATLSLLGLGAMAFVLRRKLRK